MTKKLQDALVLQERVGLLIKRERKLLNEILDAIIEADICRSYLELGHASLHAWLAKHFLYSESAAWRRIDSARMKRAVPAIEEKTENGALNLSNVARAQCAVRAEEARTKTQMSDVQKALVIEKIEGKSGIETEKILKIEFPEAKIFQSERVRVLSASEVTIQIVLAHDEYECFKRAGELLSHTISSRSPGKVVAHIFKEYVSRKDPLRRDVKRSSVNLKIEMKAVQGDRLKSGSQVARGAGANGRKTLEVSAKLKTELVADQISELNMDRVADRVAEPEVESVAESLGSPLVESVTDRVSDRVADPASESVTKSVTEPVSESITKSLADSNEFSNLELRPVDSAAESANRLNCANRSRHIPSPIRRMVFRRDRGACQAVNPVTGEICGSRFQVEADHIRPWALGGTHQFENLQCLCGQHNRHRAEAVFGARQTY